MESSVVFMGSRGRSRAGGKSPLGSGVRDGEARGYGRGPADRAAGALAFRGARPGVHPGARSPSQPGGAPAAGPHSLRALQHLLVRPGARRVDVADRNWLLGRVAAMVTTHPGDQGTGGEGGG